MLLFCSMFTVAQVKAEPLAESLGNLYDMHYNLILSDKVIGSYQELTQVNFVLNRSNYGFAGDQSDAQITVNGIDASYEVKDYQSEGDCRVLCILIPQPAALPSTNLVEMQTFNLNVVNTSNPTELKKLYELNTKIPSNFYTLKRCYRYDIATTDNWDYKYELNRSVNRPQFIGGSYIMNLYSGDYSSNNFSGNLTFRQYTPDAADGDESEPVEGELLKMDSGSLVHICPAQFDYSQSNFSLVINHCVSESGVYYLRFPLYGTINTNSDSDLNSLRNIHCNNILIGPIEITEGSLPTPILMATSRMMPSVIYSDDIPDNCDLRVDNCNSLYFDVEHPKFRIKITDGDNTAKIVAEYEVEPILSGNIISFPLKKEAVSAPGSYRFNYYVDEPIKGFSTFNSPLLREKTSSAYYLTLKVVDSEPTANVDMFVKTTNAEQVEMEDGEELTVRLFHPSTNHRIFTKWIPEEEGNTSAYSVAGAGEIPADFTEHTQDLTIICPGTLQYFTRLSNTNSETKTIHFVRKEVVPDISSVDGVATDAIENDTRELWYHINGMPATANDKGILILRKNGQATKVLK